MIVMMIMKWKPQHPGGKKLIKMLEVDEKCATGGWFSRKCTKINHSRNSICQLTVDDTRNILYTRSDKRTLTAPDTGADGCCQREMYRWHWESSNFNKLIYITPIYGLYLVQLLPGFTGGCYCLIQVMEMMEHCGASTMIYTPLITPFL